MVFIKFLFEWKKEVLKKSISISKNCPAIYICLFRYTFLSFLVALREKRSFNTSQRSRTAVSPRLRMIYNSWIKKNHFRLWLPVTSFFPPSCLHYLWALMCLRWYACRFEKFPRGFAVICSRPVEPDCRLEKSEYWMKPFSSKKWFKNTRTTENNLSVLFIAHWSYSPSSKIYFLQPHSMVFCLLPLYLFLPRLLLPCKLCLIDMHSRLWKL
jgi:hypothetical protein